MKAHSHYLLPGYRVVARVTVLVAVVSIGYRLGTAVPDTSSGPEKTYGTISGTVRGPDSSASFEGRVIELIDVDTGERQRLTSSQVGGFTFKVKPGKYRVQVELRPGEALIKQPGVMTVHRTDGDARAHFLIGNARVSRPRLPVQPGDPGLAPPVA